MGQMILGKIMGNTSLPEELRQAEEAYRNKRYEVAFDIYTRLAGQGHAESQMFVGWMHLSGLGVTSNEVEAASWFEKAAALGSTQGQFYHARYLTKTGRHSEALVFYRRAAESEYMPAIFWVGYSLVRGQGAEKNIEDGYRFLFRAAKRGHVHALREIAVLDMKGYRGLTWRLMDPIEFLVALINAFVLAYLSRESDLLRA